jgi:hypothetical protein
LLTHLFELDPPRMHLIAFGLAHAEGEASPHFGLFLARASSREIVDRVLGRRPAGIKRALQRLPNEVLERENYRHLVDLLEEPNSAKVLNHGDWINDSTIQLLLDVPVPLRRVFPLVMKYCHQQPYDFADALRFFVARGVAPNFDSLVSNLASVGQAGQFIAKIERLVEALPLPQNMPLAQVGRARRLDRTADIRKLAKRWKNCLAEYVQDIDDGERAVYLWEEEEAPAACVLKRFGRLGWFVEEVQGPRNAELEQRRLDVVEKAFADAGIPQSGIAHAIQNVLEAQTVLLAHRFKRACNGRRPPMEKVPPGDEWMAWDSAND